jgi:nitrogen fixation/metabolism regulation signal transduction histidine kinase
VKNLHDKQEHFNELTPAEAERLAILAEECAEVIQVVGKILRHGYESHNPFDPQKVTNRGLLAQELGHLDHAAMRVVCHDDVSGLVIAQSSRLKSEKIVQYLHHQF